MVKQFRDFVEEKMKSPNPCWAGYEMIGMKKKNGKEVPNCVPVAKEEVDVAQQAAKDRIKREKTADKLKHDRMMDRARINDARMANKGVK